MTTNEILLGVGLTVVLAVGSQVVASQLRIPALVVLLPAGFFAGALTDDVHPDRLLGPAFQPLVSLAVAVILYDSGLGLICTSFAGIRVAWWSGSSRLVFRSRSPSARCVRRCSWACRGSRRSCSAPFWSCLVRPLWVHFSHERCTTGRAPATDSALGGLADRSGRSDPGRGAIRRDRGGNQVWARGRARGVYRERRGRAGRRHGRNCAAVASARGDGAG